MTAYPTQMAVLTSNGILLVLKELVPHKPQRLHTPFTEPGARKGPRQ